MEPFGVQVATWLRQPLEGLGGQIMFIAGVLSDPEKLWFCSVCSALEKQTWRDSGASFSYLGEGTDVDCSPPPVWEKRCLPPFPVSQLGSPCVQKNWGLTGLRLTWPGPEAWFSSEAVGLPDPFCLSELICRADLPAVPCKPLSSEGCGEVS